MDVTIWHNPACSNSRGALKLIRDAGFDPVVIEYLGTPPDAATLRQVLAESALSARDLVRSKEPSSPNSGWKMPTMPPCWLRWPNTRA
jgi:arsenate reductase